MMQKKGFEFDFIELWYFSDFVFVVEEKKFYVYKGILFMWLLVFERMFFLEFKEKFVSEIFFLEKNVFEIKELLFVIYLILKLIGENNCYFFFFLVREY